MPDEPINNQALQPVYAEPSRKIHPAKFLIILRKKWWVLLITLSIAIGLAFAFISLKPVNFTSIGVMWITGRMQLGEGARFNDESLSQSVGTQIELLQTSELKNRAVQFAKDRNTNLFVPKDTFGQYVLPKITISSNPKSSLFVLSSTATNGFFARVFLDSLMEVFLSFKKDVRSTASTNALESISKLVETQERALKDEQEALSKKQKDDNIALLEEQLRGGSALLAQQSGQLALLKLELSLLDAVELEKNAGVLSKTNNLEVVPDPNRVSDSISKTGLPADYITANQQVQVLKAQREELSRYMRPKHPKIVRLDQEIAQGERVIEYFRKQNKEQTAAAKEAMKIRIKSIEDSINVLSTNVSSANIKMAEIQSIRAGIQRQQSIYDRLLVLLQGVDLNRNIAQESVAILQHATADEPDSRILKVIGIATVLGLLAGMGILFLIAYTDDRCNSMEEVRDYFSEEIVGQIPEVRAVKNRVASLLLRQDSEDHIFAESCKNLRSSLIFRPSEGEKPKTILITSAAPDEGKSTVAMNLARAMAFGGANVLLVDGDIRQGSLHQQLGLQANPGLTDILNASRKLAVKVRKNDADAASSHYDSSGANLALSLDAAIQSTEIPTLYFIARGTDDFIGSELFLLPGFDTFLSQVRARFDCVIIDSCPVFAADDATTLAPKMDGVLFVYRRGFTSSGLAQMALELLYQRQSKIMGLVFNRADSSSNAYRYYKYAKYYRQQKV
jgi:Mrp family chromosome partitioning ATPase/uncharacterized protein involved in exopolysaccharide biosynthesis